VVATHVQGAVTIHGMNLRTGTPVYPDAEYAEASSTPAALILSRAFPLDLHNEWLNFCEDRCREKPGPSVPIGAGEHHTAAPRYMRELERGLSLKFPMPAGSGPC
jgi:hypothetical protein